jgi:transcriptional regulator with XRE-family HTH domain
MDAEELRRGIGELGVSQADFARLLGVTSRAVNLWISSDRGVPPPAVAYLRLLLSVPKAFQAKELARLSSEETQMPEGMYLVEMKGLAGDGLAMLVLQGGRVFGSDSQVLYDGTYEPSPALPGCLDLQLKVTVPAGVPVIQGVPAQPVEYRYDLAVNIRARGSTSLHVKTPFGLVNAKVTFVREIPQDVAA